MQMIDVLKRLAQLDANNPKIVKEGTQVQECGPMGMMDSMHGMMAEKPSVPANFSINASAATGNEVADMMSQILTLAGMKQVGAGDLGAEPQGAVVTAEPVASVGPMAAEPMPTAADDMRSVLDKLNPEPAGDDHGDDGLGPFQHDSQPGGEEPAGAAEPTGGDDEPAGDEGDTEPPFAGNEGGEDEADDEEGEEETDEGQYDNSPADAEPTEPFDSNEFAHQENQPGSGETSNDKKRQSNLPTATFESLMKEYKQFIGEDAEEDEEMEEDVTDRLKDLDPKNPVNIPAYQRKAASGDSASAAKNTKESVETADILKLAGLIK